MFTSLINRNHHAPAWQKIPWHDPDFSRRMLAEHLSQAHDRASRRFSIIDQQIQWIHRKILKEQTARILDLGCGPGFYTNRLSALGHRCTGIDFSPASIAYARDHHPEGEYCLGDVVKLDYGGDFDLVCMIYGELNAFSPADAERIVEKAQAALKPGGMLLLEVHPHAVIERIGHEPPSWYTSQAGLFSDEPYLCLMESQYDMDRSITHFWVYAENGATQQYTNMLQGYTDDEYRRLLRSFERVLFYPSLTGSVEGGDLFVIVAETATGVTNIKP